MSNVRLKPRGDYYSDAAFLLKLTAVVENDPDISPELKTRAVALLSELAGLLPTLKRGKSHKKAG